MKNLFIFLILLGLIPPLFATPLSRMYNARDIVITEIKLLSIESGIVPQHMEFPITGYALLNQLNRINTDDLSEKGIKLYKTIKDNLLNTKKNPYIDSSILLNPEFYINQDSSASSRSWEYGYLDRLPFLQLEAETIFTKNIYGIVSYGLSRRESRMSFFRFETNYPQTAGNTRETNVQNSYPHTAYLSINGKAFTVAAGREHLSWGRGNTGNLVLGGNSPYYDFFQFSLQNRILRYTFLTVPMNEIDEDGNAIVDGREGYESTLFFNTLHRLFISHRLSIDISPKFRVTIGEGTLVYTDKLDPRIFSPVMFLHNYQNFYEVNNTMHLEVEYAPAKHWSLYLQLFLDQFQTKGEQGAGEVPPNAYAGLFGIDYAIRIGGGVLTAYAETAYTSPFMYLRAGDNTWIYDNDTSLTSQQRQHNLDMVHAFSMRDGESGITWLGYQYGPDSLVAELKIGYDSDSGFGVSSTIHLRVQGERGLAIDDKLQYVELVLADNLNIPSPSGDDITYTLIPKFEGYLYLPYSSIKTYAKFFLVNRWNNAGHTSDLQAVFGVKYSLTLPL
jgi:hypothetical protein